MAQGIEGIVTHEPEVALEGWPLSHVRVVDTLADDVPECLKVVIHGNEHYLHQTTAFALYQQLQAYFQNLSDAGKLFLILNGSELGPEITNVSGESNHAESGELALLSFLSGVSPVDLIEQL